MALAEACIGSDRLFAVGLGERSVPELLAPRICALECVAIQALPVATDLEHSACKLRFRLRMGLGAKASPLLVTEARQARAQAKASQLYQRL